MIAFLSPNIHQRMKEKTQKLTMLLEKTGLIPTNY